MSVSENISIHSARLFCLMIFWTSSIICSCFSGVLSALMYSGLPTRWQKTLQYLVSEIPGSYIYDRLSHKLYNRRSLRSIIHFLSEAVCPTRTNRLHIWQKADWAIQHGDIAELSLACLFSIDQGHEYGKRSKKWTSGSASHLNCRKSRRAISRSR